MRVHRFARNIRAASQACLTCRNLSVRATIRDI
jgi:hypothetical protein